MKRNRLKRLGIVVLSIILFIAATGYLLIRLTPEPPAEVLKNASSAIAEAKIVSADLSSVKMLKDAEAKYESAFALWQSENNKWILSRDYSEVRKIALEAEDIAKKARSSAILDKSNIRLQMSVSIDSVEKNIDYYKTFWKILPVQGPENKKYEKAQMLFAEAKLSYEKKDYQVGLAKLKKAGQSMLEATQVLEANLEHYFQAFSQWQSFAEKTKAASKTDRAILVDKFAAKCYLYKKGKLLKSYDAEFGMNWIGDKRREGDKATPEGMYKITRKKKGNETIYYKALLLNYPNDADKKRFIEEQKSGELPKNARIGGLIEIHGGGGRGVHWTDGCIALDDSDMDFLYDFASVNTPVTIVGSMIPLDEIKLSLQQ